MSIFSYFSYFQLFFSYFFLYSTKTYETTFMFLSLFQCFVIEYYLEWKKMKLYCYKLQDLIVIDTLFFHQIWFCYDLFSNHNFLAIFLPSNYSIEMFVRSKFSKSRKITSFLMIVSIWTA